MYIKVDNKYHISNTKYNRINIKSPLSYEPILWLDSADYTTFEFSTGNQIETWKDKSGNENNAFQSTLSLQPSVTGAKVIFNDHMLNVTATNQFDFSSTGFEFYVAFKFTTINENVLLFSKFNASNSDGRQMSPVSVVTSTKEFYFIHSQDGSNDITTNTGIVAEIGKVYNIRANFIPFQEQSITITGTTTTDVLNYGVLYNLEDSWTIGGHNVTDARFKGEIYEILYFDKQLSIQQRESVNNYLNTKWNIT